MALFKPTVFASQMYSWEGDDAVQEVLVQFEHQYGMQSKSPEKNCVLRLRAVKNGEGMFYPLIRPCGNDQGSTPILHEFPVRFNQASVAMDFLLDWLSGSFNIVHMKMKHVPNRKVD
jgi:hypothetical protein